MTTEQKLPFGEEINYWQTSQTSPDIWMEKTGKLIESRGGTVLAEAFGKEPNTGRSAYMLAFEIGGDHYKIVWPVLPSKTKNERAARIQAATLLYHDTKGKVLKSFIFGVRASFFEYLLLPDGRTAAEASNEALVEALPALFGPQRPTLNAGDVEGEFTELK